MFLHSGASLHGHEFSNKPAQASSPTNRRNSLLRSSRPSPVNRAITFPTGPPVLPDFNNASEVKRCVSFPDSRARSPDNAPVTEEPEPELPASQVEAMSEDETSIITGIEENPISSPAQIRRTNNRRRTTYILAHPPPKLRTKQRILHIRPNLVLQVQQVLPGVRPQPVIDVYPSSAIASSIIAPLLKRFPRIAPIKNELSIHDVMLVRSEDYTSRNSGSESDNDEENLMARDLLAILSSSIKEDRAEIVMADGTVWVATTRTNKTTYSYEFTAADPIGTISTARWVRKRVVSSSLPGTPTSPVSDQPKPQLSDCKFTFSFIDPDSRRHPILATLTSTSLSISDTYTTVEPSANQCQPNPHSFSPPTSPSCGDEHKGETFAQSVEEWQRAFISVSAVWVALRQGWATNFRPEDLMPYRSSSISQNSERDIHGRKRSQSVIVSPSPTAQTSPHADTIGRRKYPIGLRQNELRSANNLPRRATSTGAAFMQKRRAIQPENDDQLNDDNRITKLNRRAFSGEWNVGLLKGGHENSLAETMMDSSRGSVDTPQGDYVIASPPSSESARRRVVSAYSTLRPLSTGLDYTDVAAVGKELTSVTGEMPEQGELNESNSKGKRRKWKGMANWFRKLSRR